MHEEFFERDHEFFEQITQRRETYERLQQQGDEYGLMFHLVMQTALLLLLLLLSSFFRARCSYSAEVGHRPLARLSPHSPLLLQPPSSRLRSFT